MSEEVGHDKLLWDDEEKLDVELAPPPAAKGKKRSTAEEDGGGDELHIWTERERRKKMSNMFANLHALLPHIPPKADKSTIVDEAAKRIKELQQTVEQLEKRRLETPPHGIITHNNYNPITRDSSSFITQQTLDIDREAFSTVILASTKPLFSGPVIFKTWTSSNVVVNVCGKDAHVSICSPKKPGLLTVICIVIEKHNLEVLSAQISSDRNTYMYMIHTRANGGSDNNQFEEAFLEERYKQAAAELMLWVNSY